MTGESVFAEAIGDWSLPFPEPRFRIYRNNVVAALVNALRVRFPVTERTLGAARFGACATAYAAVRRPASPVLIDYGADFPEHVASGNDAASQPFLADLARLENLWWLAYHAADATPLDSAGLAAVPPESWAEARFAFLPSLGLLSSAHAVADIWQGKPPRAGRQEILLARPDAEVVLHAIDPRAATLIGRLRSGDTLGSAVAAVIDSFDDFDAGPALQGLLALRIITGVTT